MNSHTAIIVSLSEIASIVGGYPFRKAIEALPAGNVGVLQMANVDPFSGVDSAKTIRVELPAERKPTFLAPDDIVIAARGTGTKPATHRDPLGSSVCRRLPESPASLRQRNSKLLAMPRFLATTGTGKCCVSSTA